jgi:hypothetical protein
MVSNQVWKIGLRMYFTFYYYCGFKGYVKKYKDHPLQSTEGSRRGREEPETGGRDEETGGTSG